ncbi:hypothetical protein Acsp04_05800 [Actinomadura sp. NBRC 104425]|uniref:DUF397 domain-containing protein n=1 Tax=Actinomadura sp. NBRC 104425 TaxID=3032204 RepID=UPI0024A49D81|nr:DUF397 domain-containing protein [Actinomadura sp. NBRC 104425]GLZ10345.1 hypothetical protein Acsp04_05800 [Actinomadura sp. NBRC 104425]
MSGDEIPNAALRWRKAARNTRSGDNCVEVAAMPPGVAFRDSKNPSVPTLVFRRDEFVRFAEAVRRGAFDLEG